MRAVEEEDVEDPCAVVATPVGRRHGVERFVLVSREVAAPGTGERQGTASVRCDVRHSRLATGLAFDLCVRPAYKIVTVCCG